MPDGYQVLNYLNLAPHLTCNTYAKKFIKIPKEQNLRQFPDGAASEQKPASERAEKTGRELLVQGAPELLEFATKKKSAKQALKSTVAKTARKQIGGALQRGRKAIYRRRSKKKAYKKQTLPKKKIISRKTKPQRSRSDFFSKVKNAYYHCYSHRGNL